MTRDYGRAPRGQRVLGSVPRNRGEVTTMIGALGIKGIRALMTVEGGTDADVFEAFVEQFLVRKLQPGDIVVLDNVGAHKPTRIRALVEAAGARLIFLPPYSPDLNPIELGWSKLKGILKDFGARTRDALDAAIRRGIDLIGADDARAWFTHCGYEAPGK
jgi:transposase